MNKAQIREARKYYNALCESIHELPKQDRRFVGGPCCLCGKGHDTKDCPSSERR